MVRERDDDDGYGITDADDPVKKIVRLVMLVIGIVFVIIILFGMFYIVDAGERAVILTWGAASPNSIGPGLHFKIPIVQDVIKFEVRTQKYEAEASAASSDLQTVTAKMAVNYHLIPESVPKIYVEMGNDYATRVIMPLEQEIVKATTAQYTAEELITKRETVRLEIKKELIDRLSPRGIIVEEISIVNFDFSKTFNDAIEAKVTAEQSALAAKNKLVQVQYEAQQKVAAATAEAEALRLQKQEITPDLLRLRQIEVQQKAVDKWNGILPQVTGNAIPFISLNSQTNQTQ